MNRIFIECKNDNINYIKNIFSRISKHNYEFFVYNIYYISCAYGSIKVLKFIIDKVDVNKVNNNGDTGLIIACYNNKENIVDYLLNLPNININYINVNNEVNALIVCCMEGNLNILKKLMCDPRTNINCKTEYDLTLFLLSCQYNYLDIVDYFISINMSVNNVDFLNNNALIIACYEENFEIIKYLIENTNINIDHKNNFGNNVLLVACYENHIEIVKYLLEETNIDINIKNNLGNNILMISCLNNNLEILLYLIDNTEIDINTFNNYGDTIMSIAIDNGNFEILNKLIKNKRIALDKIRLFNNIYYSILDILLNIKVDNVNMYKIIEYIIYNTEIRIQKKIADNLNYNIKNMIINLINKKKEKIILKNILLPKDLVNIIYEYNENIIWKDIEMYIIK